MHLLLDRLTWEPVPGVAPSDGLPFVTHQGVLTLPDLPPLRVYVLNTGVRVIDEDDLAVWLLALGDTP